jgi:hypothetical protein
MRRDLFQPTIEGEARLLLLIHAFSGNGGTLDGRTKLAKLDFLLRYPPLFARALAQRSNLTVRARAAIAAAQGEGHTIESRMMRYKYGPFDPAHYGLLGRLIGKRLIVMLPGQNGLVFRSSERGAALAEALAATEVWAGTAERCRLLESYFNLSASALARFIDTHFPEVAGTKIGDML